jgi:hypothetical protein
MLVDESKNRVTAIVITVPEIVIVVTRVTAIGHIELRIAGSMY